MADKVDLPKGGMKGSVHKALEDALNGKQCPEPLPANFAAMQAAERDALIKKHYPMMERVTDLSLIGADTTPEQAEKLRSNERKVG